MRHFSLNLNQSRCSTSCDTMSILVKYPHPETSKLNSNKFPWKHFSIKHNIFIWSEKQRHKWALDTRHGDKKKWITTLRIWLCHFQSSRTDRHWFWYPVSGSTVASPSSSLTAQLYQANHGLFFQYIKGNKCLFTARIKMQTEHLQWCWHMNSN